MGGDRPTYTVTAEHRQLRPGVRLIRVYLTRPGRERTLAARFIARRSGKRGSYWRLRRDVLIGRPGQRGAQGLTIGIYSALSDAVTAAENVIWGDLTRAPIIG